MLVILLEVVLVLVLVLVLVQVLDLVTHTLVLRRILMAQALAGHLTPCREFSDQ
jgi:hypothetical protein